MTKTLTEQWREETLSEGLYYIEGNGNHDIALIRNRYCPVLTSPFCEDDVFESEFVPVDPVPSYDEYKELVRKSDKLDKQLAIATKALERYSKDDYYGEGGGRFVNPYPHIARKALKEMEGVK